MVDRGVPAAGLGVDLASGVAIVFVSRAGDFERVGVFLRGVVAAFFCGDTFWARFGVLERARERLRDLAGLAAA